MAYIETHQALLTHRKTLRLSRLLGIDRWGVAGRLMALWSWALDNAQEGVIAQEDSDILADIMGWDGEPSALCHALVTAGFLDQHANHYAIHDWMDYAGRLIEKRKSDAERKRQARASSGHTPPVQRTSGGHPADGAGTLPNPTLPNPISSHGDGLSNRESADEAPEPTPEGEPLARTRTLSPQAKSATEKPTPPKKSANRPAEPKPRPKNPLWDVLVETFYEPTTPDERKLFGKIVHDLNEVAATPDDVRARVLAHKRAQSHWDLTPRALVTHWSELGALCAGSNGNGTTESARRAALARADALEDERARQHAEMVRELAQRAAGR